MDGVHDLGGLDGFGQVEHSDREPMFAEDWERRTFRMMVGSIGAVGGPGGSFRHSFERMGPAHYLSSPYYEHWLTGVTTLFWWKRGSRRSVALEALVIDMNLATAAALDAAAPTERAPL